MSATAAFLQMQALVTAQNKGRLLKARLAPLWSELTDYLTLEGERFRRFSEVFEDSETCREFTKLSGLFLDLRTIALELASVQDGDHSLSLLQQALDLDDEIREACDFLMN